MGAVIFVCVIGFLVFLMIYSVTPSGTPGMNNVQAAIAKKNEFVLHSPEDYLRKEIEVTLIKLRHATSESKLRNIMSGVRQQLDIERLAGTDMAVVKPWALKRMGIEARQWFWTEAERKEKRGEAWGVIASLEGALEFSTGPEAARCKNAIDAVAMGGGLKGDKRV